MTHPSGTDEMQISTNNSDYYTTRTEDASSDKDVDMEIDDVACETVDPDEQLSENISGNNPIAFSSYIEEPTNKTGEVSIPGKSISQLRNIFEKGSNTHSPEDTREPKVVFQNVKLSESRQIWSHGVNHTEKESTELNDNSCAKISDIAEPQPYTGIDIDALHVPDKDICVDVIIDKECVHKVGTESEKIVTSSESVYDNDDYTSSHVTSVTPVEEKAIASFQISDTAEGTEKSTDTSLYGSPISVIPSLDSSMEVLNEKEECGINKNLDSDLREEGDNVNIVDNLSCSSWTVRCESYERIINILSSLKTENIEDIFNNINQYQILKEAISCNVSNICGESNPKGQTAALRMLTEYSSHIASCLSVIDSYMKKDFAGEGCSNEEVHADSELNTLERDGQFPYVDNAIFSILSIPQRDFLVSGIINKYLSASPGVQKIAIKVLNLILQTEGGILGEILIRGKIREMKGCMSDSDDNNKGVLILVSEFLRNLLDPKKDKNKPGKGVVSKIGSCLLSVIKMGLESFGLHQLSSISDIFSELGVIALSQNTSNSNSTEGGIPPRKVSTLSLIIDICTSCLANSERSFKEGAYEIICELVNWIPVDVVFQIVDGKIEPKILNELQRRVDIQKRCKDKEDDQVGNSITKEGEHSFSPRTPPLLIPFLDTYTSSKKSSSSSKKGKVKTEDIAFDMAIGVDVFKNLKKGFSNLITGNEKWKVRKDALGGLTEACRKSKKLVIVSHEQVTEVIHSLARVLKTEQNIPMLLEAIHCTTAIIMGLRNPVPPSITPLSMKNLVLAMVSRLKDKNPGIHDSSIECLVKLYIYRLMSLDGYIVDALCSLGLDKSATSKKNICRLLIHIWSEDPSISDPSLIKGVSGKTTSSTSLSNPDVVARILTDIGSSCISDSEKGVREIGCTLCTTILGCKSTRTPRGVEILRRTIDKLTDARRQIVSSLIPGLYETELHVEEVGGLKQEGVTAQIIAHSSKNVENIATRGTVYGIRDVLVTGYPPLTKSVHKVQNSPGERDSEFTENGAPSSELKNIPVLTKRAKKPVNGCTHNLRGSPPGASGLNNPLPSTLPKPSGGGQKRNKHVHQQKSQNVNKFGVSMDQLNNSGMSGISGSSSSMSTSSILYSNLMGSTSTLKTSKDTIQESHTPSLEKTTPSTAQRILREGKTKIKTTQKHLEQVVCQKNLPTGITVPLIVASKEFIKSPQLAKPWSPSTLPNATPYIKGAFACALSGPDHEKFVQKMFTLSDMNGICESLSSWVSLIDNLRVSTGVTHQRQPGPSIETTHHSIDFRLCDLLYIWVAWAICANDNPKVLKSSVIFLEKLLSLSWSMNKGDLEKEGIMDSDVDLLFISPPAANEQAILLSCMLERIGQSNVTRSILRPIIRDFLVPRSDHRVFLSVLISSIGGRNHKGVVDYWIFTCLLFERILEKVNSQSEYDDCHTPCRSMNTVMPQNVGTPYSVPQIFPSNALAREFVHHLLLALTNRDSSIRSNSSRVLDIFLQCSFATSSSLIRNHLKDPGCKLSTEQRCIINMRVKSSETICTSTSRDRLSPTPSNDDNLGANKHPFGDWNRSIEVDMESVSGTQTTPVDLHEEINSCLDISDALDSETKKINKGVTYEPQVKSITESRTSVRRSPSVDDGNSLCSDDINMLTSQEQIIETTGVPENKEMYTSSDNTRVQLKENQQPNSRVFNMHHKARNYDEHIRQSALDSQNITERGNNKGGLHNIVHTERNKTRRTSETTAPWGGYPWERVLTFTTVPSGSFLFSIIQEMLSCLKNETLLVIENRNTFIRGVAALLDHCRGSDLLVRRRLAGDFVELVNAVQKNAKIWSDISEISLSSFYAAALSLIQSRALQDSGEEMINTSYVANLKKSPIVTTFSALLRVSRLPNSKLRACLIQSLGKLRRRLISHREKMGRVDKDAPFSEEGLDSTPLSTREHDSIEDYTNRLLEVVGLHLKGILEDWVHPDDQASDSRRCNSISLKCMYPEYMSRIEYISVAILVLAIKEVNPPGDICKFVASRISSQSSSISLLERDLWESLLSDKTEKTIMELLVNRRNKTEKEKSEKNPELRTRHDEHAEKFGCESYKGRNIYKGDPDQEEEYGIQIRNGNSGSIMSSTSIREKNSEKEMVSYSSNNEGVRPITPRVPQTVGKKESQYEQSKNLEPDKPDTVMEDSSELPKGGVNLLRSQSRDNGNNFATRKPQGMGDRIRMQIERLEMSGRFHDN